jgi:hypothetical protein
MAMDAERGGESQATKDARGAGGVNQAQAVKEAAWATIMASDESRGRDTRLTNTKTPRPKNGHKRQVIEGHWQTCVAEDKEQSGSAARGPSQTSQVRESNWAGPLSRDGKDTTVPPQGENAYLSRQVIRAAGPTSDGA